MHRKTLILVGILSLSSGMALASGPKEHAPGRNGARRHDRVGVGTKPISHAESRRQERSTDRRSPALSRSDDQGRVDRPERGSSPRRPARRIRDEGSGVFIGDYELSARELAELERRAAEYESLGGWEAMGGFGGELAWSPGVMDIRLLEEQAAYENALNSQAYLMQWYAAQMGAGGNWGYDGGYQGGGGEFAGSGLWGDLGGTGAMGTDGYVMLDNGDSWWPGK
jgi:hypothetical protein